MISKIKALINTVIDKKITGVKMGSSTGPQASELKSVQPVAPTSSTTDAAVILNISVPTINIIDRSTLLSDTDFNAMVEAVRIQFEQHVAPLWMKGPWKIVVNEPESVGFPIVILDDPDQAGMLGYHTKSPGGKVWGRVFVKAVFGIKGQMLTGPKSVSAILSHEVIEAFCNANVNLWAKTNDGRMIAYEIADPVENDWYDVQVSDGRKVSVSNFVLPAWFDPYAPADAQFDYLKKVKKPFVMSKGGYIVTMNPKTGVVKNVFGSIAAERDHSERQAPHIASRSNRMIDLITEEKPETVIMTDDDGDS